MVKNHNNCKGFCILFHQKKYLFILGLILLLVFSSCRNTLQVEDFTADHAGQYLYFAHPQGGIRAFHPLAQSISIITQEYDFHPNYLEDNSLYFLRYSKPPSAKDKKLPVEVKVWHPLSGKLETIQSLTSLPSLPDLKNQVFFVDNGSKLLLINHFKDILLIDILSDKAIPLENMGQYFREINYGSTDGTEVFMWIHQHPYQNILKNSDLLETPSEQSTIISIDKNYKAQIWNEIESQHIFEQYYYGIAYHQEYNRLYISKNQELISYVSPAAPAVTITEGVHPFCTKTISPSPLASFPLLVTSLFVADNENYFIGSSNYLSYVNKEETSYLPLDSTNTPLQAKSMVDPHYLFDRLIFLARFKALPSSFFLVSMSKSEAVPGSELFTVERDQTDVSTLFSYSPGTWTNHWIKSGQYYSSIEFKDLNSDQNLEIINYFCVSSFRCPGEMLQNSRSLVWMDVYVLNKNNYYETVNESYPEFYQTLWTQLEEVKKQEQEAKRLNRLFFCEEDSLLLQELLSESYRLASP